VISLNSRAPTDKASLQALISLHLASVRAERDKCARDAAKATSVGALKRFQAARLLRTYADLHSQPRFRAAVEFFTRDLYGDRDFSRRDADLQRIVPSIAKLFPVEALATIEAALQLHALAEALDLAMASNAGWASVWTDDSYAQAWQTTGEREQRFRQLELVQITGERLDKLVRVPLIGFSLKAMSAPAAIAGLSELHGFLLRGYSAFKALNGAAEFLRTINSREAALMQGLFERPAASI
jgi:hypothetical protein